MWYELVIIISELNSISLKLYRLASVLGEGQFSVVRKGVWKRNNAGHGFVLEVAAKTLKLGSEERDKVKLLQEAAIMAQFKHSNVITLYGVVSNGGVVSFCMCYPKISQWCIVEFAINSDNDYCGIATKRRSQTTSDCHDARVSKTGVRVNPC